MLEENKRIYESKANTIVPDWKSRNKNDLIISASECTDERLKDGYIAAIMLKYWSKIDSYYYKCKLVTTPEDIHSWLVTAVLYALKHKPWENPKYTVYKDENGPDKVINRIIESKRLTFYQQLNRYKRKINSAITSLDSLVEDYKDVFVPSYNDSSNVECNNLVCMYFDKKDYFMAFMLDAIFYEDVMSKDGLNKRRLSVHIKNIDDIYCNIFADRYDIPLNKVTFAAPYVTNMSSYNMKNKIEYNLIKLKSIIGEGVK